MKGHADVLDALNDVLTAELTSINQYFVHHRMCANWGYPRLSRRKYRESIARMKAADRVIERILLLEGVPNLQRLSPVRVGEDPIEQHQLDLESEVEGVRRLNASIALAAQHADNGTRELLEKVLLEREEAVDWHETQLHAAGELGRQEYLAEQLHD